MKKEGNTRDTISEKQDYIVWVPATNECSNGSKECGNVHQKEEEREEGLEGCGSLKLMQHWMQEDCSKVIE